MMSSVACLAKADQMDVLSRQSDIEGGREAYASLARSWRRNAVMAQEQEAYARVRPTA
jgi:hypothetical protein